MWGLEKVVYLKTLWKYSKNHKTLHTPINSVYCSKVELLIGGIMKRIKIPLCGCGCGNQVTKSSRKKGTWNQFLPGHNLKIKLPEEIELQRRKKISEALTLYLKDNEDARKQRGDAWRGRKHTVESKKKMSIKATGTRNGMYGKTHTEEAKKKISEYWKGKACSEETKKKISVANSGKGRPPELRKRLSKSLKLYYTNNESVWKGRKHTEKSKQKMSKSLKGIYIKEKASNWRGGISSLPYSVEWDRWLREEIKERDNHICQNPKCEGISDILDIHHIDYNKENNEKNNLITICKSCHGKTQFKRKYWVWYYKKLMRRINK